jgi:glycosyltransferase involved in cell wall biosynthesis
MLCSTIIPTVNRPSLERAVKSALEQGLGPEEHEIIVVNDSGRPLPETDWLQSPQIIILNTNKTERSVACNTGSAIATGKYIKILHDDDYLLPGALKALVEVAEKTGCYWAYGGFNRVDDDNEFMSTQQPEVRGNLFAHSVAGDSLHLSASLIRRDVYFKLGAFDPLNLTSEDIDLQWRVALNGNIFFANQLVANIRVGSLGNTTTNWSNKTHDMRIVREKALDATGAFTRVKDSVRGDATLRGRCCRAYIVSAVLNLRAGNFCSVTKRLICALFLAGPSSLLPEFWRGMLMRSHWHRNEKGREEEHYATRHPETFRNQSQ